MHRIPVLLLDIRRSSNHYKHMFAANEAISGGNNFPRVVDTR